MKVTIPQKFDVLRRELARSHNRRVMLLVLGISAIIMVAVLPLARSQGTEIQLVLALVVAALTGIFGIISIIRLSKQQSVALGYVCPLCGGALYDGRSNRLGFRGECPRCKKFIIEKLSEEHPT